MELVEPYEELEMKFKEWSQIPHGHPVACSSGTAALHLALEACQFPPGSQVIIPEFTMIAVARAVVAAGLVPVPVDIRRDSMDETWTIDPQQIDDKITEKTVAIIACHIYGRLCDMPALMAICQENGLTLIEDAAEAPIPGKNGYAHISCWSFYKNKIIAGEEGGMVMFMDSDKAALAASLRCQGFTEDHDFRHIPRGMNYRMPNAQAKLILTDLEHYTENVEARRVMERWMEQCLPKPPLCYPNRKARAVPWVFDFATMVLNEYQDELVKFCRARSVPLRHSFKPISSQPEFIGHYKHLESYAIANQWVYLPLSNIALFDPKEMRNEVQRWTDVIAEYMNQE